MAENVYDGLFLLDSHRYGRNPGAVAGQISEMIEKAGGSMLVSRLWEERRLAYQIKGHRKGTYWLTYFRLEGERLAEVERKCRLNENILRTMFLKVDPRIVDALVAHAQHDPTAKPKQEKSAEAAASTKAVAVAKEDSAKEDSAKSTGSAESTGDTPNED